MFTVAGVNTITGYYVQFCLQFSTVSGFLGLLVTMLQLSFTVVFMVAEIFSRY